MTKPGAIRDWYVGLTAIGRVQASAILFLVASAAGRFFGLPREPTGLTLAVSLGLFTWAFLLWCRPYVCAIWASSLGKVALGVVHLIVLWFASAYALSVIAGATGLPPREFGLTVSALTFMLYVPVSLLFTGLALMVFVIVLQTVAIFQEHLYWRYVGLVVGAFALASGLVGVAQWGIGNERVFYPLARQIAYVSDFQPAPNYLGVAADEKIYALDNELVAVAVLRSNEVTFSVRSLPGR